MTPAPLRCVVDASVGIKLFIAEELSGRAQTLFNHLAADPPGLLYVPDLFFIECANTLWKYARRFGRSADDARHDAENLQALALRPVPTSMLMSAALQLALAHNISCYDACYVALAEQLQAPLITADLRLVRALARPDVQWLGDFSAEQPAAQSEK